MEKIALKNLTKTLLRGLMSGEDCGYIRLPRRLTQGLFSADPEERRLWSEGISRSPTNGY